MDKSNPPRAYGVFKPTGHVVIAYPDKASADGAAAELQKLGFVGEDLVRYTPAEMRAQVEADEHTAGPSASVGQELNLVRAHGDLALKGCHFIVVHAHNGKKVEAVQPVIDAFGATAAQRYGPFIIEELVDAPTGEPQSFESPDRGLDLPVANEGAPSAPTTPTTTQRW